MRSLFPDSSATLDQARALYIHIRQGNGLTRQQLSESLGMPATSLNRALEKQIQLGLVEEYDQAESSGGRRPGLYHVVADAFCLLGLDLSRHASRLVVTDLKLTVMAEQELPGLVQLLEQEPAARIRAACAHLIQEQAIAPEKILGLGIGWTSTAPVDLAGLARSDMPDQQEEDTRSTNPLLDQTSLASLFSQLEHSFDWPVFALRGADAALYAGLWLNRDLTSSTLLYFSAGQTIRFGMAWQGQLHPADLQTDSISSFIVAVPGKEGGQRLDQVATIPAIVRHFRKAKSDNSLTWLDFCQAVAAGKKKATNILTEAAWAMTQAIRNTVLLTGGRHVLLGGSALYDLPAYASAITANLAGSVKDGSADMVVIDNPLARKILAVGAAAYVLENNLRRS